MSPLTKQDEIRLFTKWVDSLPGDTYLYSILSPLVPSVSEAILNDFGFIDWHELTRAQADLQKTIKAMEGKVKELECQVTDYARRIHAQTEMLNDLRRQARRMSEAA